jgi:mRNA-degrading endonuclease RelE of RelBE toxin-antitoxin system
MSFKVILTPIFQKEAKKLAKKYPSLKNDLLILGNKLSENPTTGTSLGNQLFKIRLAISSKGKGKSAGARVITYAKVVENKVYLVSIYDKSELENLTMEQIQTLIQKSGLDQ